jgi:Protein of unknown function (DUF2996)
MAEEQTQNEAEQAPSPVEQQAPDGETPKAAAKTEADKPAAKAKKEKAPAVEDKPFADFIPQDFLPALKAGLAKQGIQEFELAFEQQPIGIKGLQQAPPCWQIIGRWNSAYKQPKEFRLYFFDGDIQGQKGFSYTESTVKASTLESFLIDERKVNLGLLVFGTLQRLNAQKWLVRN